MVTKPISENEQKMREAAAARAAEIKSKMDKEEQARADKREESRLIGEEKARKKAE